MPQTTIATPVESTPTMTNKPEGKMEVLLSDVEEKIVSGKKMDIVGIIGSIQSRIAREDTIEKIVPGK